jgi:hypothetical protein
VRSLLLAACLLAAAPAAHAHIGASVAKANYYHPVPPGLAFADGGMVYTYTPEEADASYHIDWQDGDVDPTGNFTFYYLDHGVPENVSAADVEANFPVVVDTMGREARRIFVACMCIVDAGITCPDLDGGARWCDNYVDWDTSAVPDGVYWLAAVNHDPPFYVDNLSYAPVRVRHAANPPLPVGIVIRPGDGSLAEADRNYHVVAIATGTGGLTFDFAWGPDLPMQALGPTTSIQKGLAIAEGADGTYGFDWDTSQLPNSSYFVRLTVHDANGTSYTDSRFGVGVYHDVGDGGPPQDLSAGSDGSIELPPPKMGCGCALGARPRGPAIALVLGMVVAALRRRRPRRRPAF